MICWSCEKNAGDGLLCAGCGAIQPPDPNADHFQVLGVARRYDLDIEALERAYKTLTRTLHPDRFAKADPRARRASLARSVQLNEAWKTLKDPVRRAEYLLALEGIEVGGEEGTKRRGPDGETQRVPVPQDLLMEVLDLREALLEARVAGDEAQVAALAADVRQRRSAALASVALGFGVGGGNREPLVRALVQVRYYDRFIGEVAAHEEARFAEGASSHAG